MKTLWYIICLVFAFQSLEILFEESNEVIYEKSNKTESVQYLICEKLSDLYPNETEIDLKKLWADMYNRYQNFSSGWRRDHHSEFIWNQTNIGRYLVFNRRVCLIANDEEEFEKICVLLHLSPRTKKTYFAISKDTFDLVKMFQWYDTVEQLTVLKKGHPYSDCSERNPRFRCLNECFRRRFRLDKYLYEDHETGRVLLNYRDGNGTIEEGEKTCFGKCRRENCKLVQMILAYILKQPKVEIFKAHRKLSAFDYWIQLVGIVTSFAGLSLNEFASLAIGFGQLKVKRKKVRIALFCLKLAILLLGLASLGYLCTRVALGHRAENDNPIEKEGTKRLILPKTIHLAICVHISPYLNGIYEEKTMEEVERATKGALEDALEGIYVDYQGRSFPTDYRVEPKKIFKFSFRCFSLYLNPNYYAIPSSPMLRITFKEDVQTPHLYLLTEDENLNEKSFWYSGRFAFQKRIVTRLRSRRNCVDYKEKYVNCTGRQNCVERCIFRKFIERFNKTTWYSQVIDRDWFSPKEWNTIRSMRFRHFNRSIYEPIHQQCLEEIADEKTCVETKFEETVQIDQLNRNTREIFIDLQFEVIQSSEEEPSWYKLALNITSIQAIIFGLTAFSILQMILQMIASLTQTAFGVRANKFVLFLLYLLCSFGASWHTYHILHLVLNGELVPTQHYEPVKRVQMPAMVFCLQIDKKLIDENHQLSGNYLDELTSQMTAENFFESIAYLNESNEWTSFDHKRVKRFFLLSMKCFQIDIDQQYDRDQFHFYKESQVLKVNFIKTTNRGNIVRFMTRSKASAEFSKITGLDLLFSWAYSITHETSLYKYEDRFSFIRRHFTSFQEDEASDLQRQLLELQSCGSNLKTLNMPLEEGAFGLKVDEDLFEQLYHSSVEKGKNKGTNYQQLFVVNHLRTDWDRLSDSEFSFNLVFLQKVVSSTNEENFGQLILGLLNVLFIWFDLGVLDLHSIFAHFHLLVYLYLHLPAFICKRLKKLKSLLNERLNHWQSSSVCRRPAGRAGRF